MIGARPFLIALTLTVPAVRAGSPDERSVIAAVQRTFDGMAARNAGMIRASFLPQAQIFLVGPNLEPRVITVEQFANEIASQSASLHERMWDPKIQIAGRIAALWAPYDLHVDGKFSHCGVDAVQLVKAGDDWKISSITYTMQREGCPPSPLGPPKN